MKEAAPCERPPLQLGFGYTVYFINPFAIVWSCMLLVPS